MENNQNLTVWQRLSATFGPNSMLNQDIPTYKFDRKELLRTQDKASFEREKLQAQQSFYLSNQWAKIDNHLYTQAVYYEPTRLASVYDFESMEYSIAGETKIATPNGFITIKELADKGRDYEFITYAYDHNLKKVVPAKAYNAHYTRDEMTYKITFDDNSHIIATHGHRFLKRDGVFCVVEELQIGDSMMPFYRKSFYDNQNYNWVYTCNKEEGHHGWVSEHKMIAEWFNNVKINVDEEVHHIDFNGKNNLPENLKIMNISEHRAYHARLNNEKLWANPEYRKKMSEVARRKGKHFWNGERVGKNNPSYIKLDFDKLVEVAKSARLLNETANQLGVSYRKIQNELRFKGFKHWDDFLKFYGIKKYLKQSENYELVDFRVIPWDLLVETARSEKLMKNVANKLGITTSKLSSTIETGGYKNWTTFMAAYGLDVGKTGRKKVVEEDIVNHKIISIEPYGVVPVYDLTVPGYKNFATDTIFSHNTPEIGAALDIYAEESTTTNEDGHMLQVYSESKRVKSVLTDLFNNILDINTSLPMWTRNTCKFGDNFVFLKLDPEKGVVGCSQLPNIEIERIEPGSTEKVSTQGIVNSDDQSLKFRWKNKQMEFQAWEVAHFRILGDDRKLPYGTCLKYDTKVDTEFGVKEIKDIQKGDLVWSFDLNTEQKVLSKVLDTVNSGIKNCYQIHTKHNFIEASKEHKILIHKNDEFIYKNVLDLEIGDYLVIDNTKGKVKDTKIDKSQPNENKNGWFNSVGLIPDFVNEEFARFFGFMIGDGWCSNNTVCFALSEYEELNDFYISILNKYSKNPVRIIEVNNKETQCVVNSKCLKTIMERMGFIGNAHTKRLPEWIYYSDIKIQKAFLEGLIDADGWITQDKWSTHLNIELCNKDLVKDVKTLCQKIGYKSGSIRKREPRKNLIIEGRSIKSSNPSFSLTFYDTLLTQTKKHDNHNRKSEDYILEPINKIIEIGEFETYDIYVENENHNFYANGVVVHNSLLEKARRIWKQLLLSEDAMLIYRTSRAPERRVFKVFVGNMDDNDVESYVQRVANKFKREQIVDNKTGNVDMRYNQMAVDQDYFVPVRDPSQGSPIETLPGACISLDTRIPLLNGKTLELSEIIKEWDNGNRDLWVYSCNPENGDLAPGLITWAGITRRDAKVLKITLDNGEQITTTPDHKFVHRYDGFVEAQNLKVGDSLMPFYRKQESNQIWNINTLNWSYITPPNETKYETLEKDWEVLDVDALNNHKIVSIEILTETMDTGTITVDGNEIYHNYHTFAIESGIFIKNSNLGEIADIEYIQKKLVTALRIPKTFLGFEDVVGDGKTLSLQDIRFARTINRIQKCMVSELNKIAIIHLFLLGFEDELSNFTLGLTNPSTQADLLKIDIWKEKIALYRDAVADPGTGIAPVSATWAKKHVFGWSDEEIRLDLQQQRIERAAGEELKNTPLIIKKTGLFDNIDKLYGSTTGSTVGASATEAPPPPEGGMDMGGMDMGGLDMGAPPPPAEDMGVPQPEPGLAPESRIRNLNILLEKNIINGVNYVPLTKGSQSLGDLEKELKKLLN
jgi:intein/homing endonuclease